MKKAKIVFVLRVGTGGAQTRTADGKLAPTNNKIASGIFAEYRRHLPNSLPKEVKNG